MKLRQTSLALVGVAQLLAAGAALGNDAAPAGPLDIGNFSMTIWGTTEYMFRGISNSDGPAIQSSIDWTYNGFYLGAWGSNTEFSDSYIEIDFYGGYRWSWLGWGFDVAGLYYAHPGENGTLGEGLDPALASDPEADYIEGQLLLSKTFETAWSPSVALKYNYSPDFFGSDGTGHAAQGDLGIFVPLGFLGDVGFSGTVGYQTVEGDKSSGAAVGIVENAATGELLDGFDYVWWRVGAYKDIGGFKFDVSYYATDQSEDLEAFYPSLANPSDFRDLIEPHVVLTVSRSFSFP